MQRTKVWYSFLLSLVLPFTLQDDSCRQRSTPATNNAAANGTPAASNDRKGQVTKDMKALPEGAWGGPNVRLFVTDSGATIEYDCAHGTVDQKLELDLAGHFDVRGTHEDETGGPAQAITAVDEEGKVSSNNSSAGGQPAHYTGGVTGKAMTLTVTLIHTSRTIGTFRLKRGVTPRLNKCWR